MRNRRNLPFLKSSLNNSARFLLSVQKISNTALHIGILILIIIIIRKLKLYFNLNSWEIRNLIFTYKCLKKNKASMRSCFSRRYRKKTFASIISLNLHLSPQKMCQWLTILIQGECRKMCLIWIFLIRIMLHLLHKEARKYWKNHKLKWLLGQEWENLDRLWINHRIEMVL